MKKPTLPQFLFRIMNWFNSKKREQAQFIITTRNSATLFRNQSLKDKNEVEEELKEYEINFTPAIGDKVYIRAQQGAYFAHSMVMGTIIKGFFSETVNEPLYVVEYIIPQSTKISYAVCVYDDLVFYKKGTIFTGIINKNRIDIISIY